MKVLLLSPLANCSGNNTTISRLRGHFEKNGYQSELTSPESFSGRDEFSTFIQNGSFHMILAIHAYKSGFLLIGCKVPYILTLGGTDVNHCTDDPDKMAVMTEAIQNARHIVCFGPSLRNAFFEKWPTHTEANVSIVPQAVEVKCNEFNITEYIQNNIQTTQAANTITSVYNEEDEIKSGNKSNLNDHQWDKSKVQSLSMQSHDHVEKSHDMSHDSSRLTPSGGHVSCDLKEESKNTVHVSYCIDKELQPADDLDHHLYDNHHHHHHHHHNNHPGNDHYHRDNNYHHDNNHHHHDNNHHHFGNYRHPGNHHHNDKNHSCHGNNDQQHGNNHHLHGNNSLDVVQRPPISKIPETLFFTLVGGIRPVKDQLYLVNEFSEWARMKKINCCLLIIGPKMDEEYFCHFKKTIASQQNVIYIPGLSLEDTHSAIRDSFALVNTSLSEGMAISILEAMCVNTPVIVRDIPGNRAIVKDGETGLLFNTPQKFLEKADRLIENREELKRLTCNAKQYTTDNHSMMEEEQAYLKLAQAIR